MFFDLIFTQIYPIINYYSLASAFSLTFEHKRGTIWFSKTSKLFTMIFLPLLAPFILFQLFLFYFKYILGNNPEMGYDKHYHQHPPQKPNLAFWSYCHCLILVQANLPCIMCTCTSFVTIFLHPMKSITNVSLHKIHHLRHDFALGT